MDSKPKTVTILAVFSVLAFFLLAILRGQIADYIKILDIELHFGPPPPPGPPPNYVPPPPPGPPPNYVPPPQPKPPNVSPSAPLDGVWRIVVDSSEGEPSAVVMRMALPEVAQLRFSGPEFDMVWTGFTGGYTSGPKQDALVHGPWTLSGDTLTLNIASGDAPALFLVTGALGNNDQFRRIADGSFESKLYPALSGSGPGFRYRLLRVSG